MDNSAERAQHILGRINELATISDEPSGITRVLGSPAFLRGSARILRWMREAGLDAGIDNIGNVRGRLSAAVPNAKTFVIASHIDTVHNAGRFDGPLGVLMGLELVRELSAAGEALPFHIELVAFSDEEGVRFHTTYLGSKVLAGTFEASLLDARDENNISLKDVISSMHANADLIMDDAIAAEDWLGYFEIHIEQGPVLYQRDVPVAVVTAIAGQQRMEMHFTGTAGHAGTVPMGMRQDALAAAAECIREIEKAATSLKGKAVATVGKLTIPNAASNTIAGEVICSLDIRSADAAVLAQLHTTISTNCQAICHHRGINFTFKPVQQTDPVICNVRLNRLLATAVKQSGYPLVELVSGAGHDAVAIAAVAPVSMLFVRCFEGISHHPRENVEAKDIAGAIKVSDNFIRQLIRQQAALQ